MNMDKNTHAYTSTYSTIPFVLYNVTIAELEEQVSVY